jgi:hypothetical protein
MVGREDAPGALRVRIVPRMIGREVYGHVGCAILIGACRHHRLRNADNGYVVHS